MPISHPPTLVQDRAALRAAILRLPINLQLRIASEKVRQAKCLPPSKDVLKDLRLRDLPERLRSGLGGDIRLDLAVVDLAVVKTHAVLFDVKGKGLVRLSFYASWPVQGQPNLIRELILKLPAGTPVCIRMETSLDLANDTTLLTDVKDHVVITQVKIYSQ